MISKDESTRALESDGLALAKVVPLLSLRRTIDNAPFVEVQAKSIGETLQAVAARYPKFGPAVLDGPERLKNSILVFIDGVQVGGNSSDVLSSTFQNGVTITLIAAMAGG
jgi:hypothetical protein